MNKMMHNSRTVFARYGGGGVYDGGVALVWAAGAMSSNVGACFVTNVLSDLMFYYGRDTHANG